MHFAVDLNPIAAFAVLKPTHERGDGVGELPGSPFEAEVDRGHDLGVHSNPGHKRKTPPIRLAQVDRGCGPVEDRVGDFGRGNTQTDFGGQHVGGAQRQDGQWDRPACQTVHDLVDGAITSGGDDKIGCFGALASKAVLRSESLRVACLCGGAKGNIGSAALKSCDYLRQTPPSGTAGRRIEDDRDVSPRPFLLALCISSESAAPSCWLKSFGLIWLAPLKAFVSNASPPFSSFPIQLLHIRRERRRLIGG